MSYLDELDFDKYLAVNKIKVGYTEWIDSYTGNELDEAGMKRFEMELSINGDLAFEYNLEKDMDKSLSQLDLLDFRAKCIMAQNELNLSGRKFVINTAKIKMMHKKKPI